MTVAESLGVDPYPIEDSFWSWSISDPEPWIQLAHFVNSDLLPVQVKQLYQDRAIFNGKMARREAFDELWRAFARLRVPYLAPPWAPGRRQRLRAPEQVLTEGGTCLDLALTFAAMALSTGLRPYLVVDPTTTQDCGHIVILIDLELPVHKYDEPFQILGRGPGSGLWAITSRGRLRPYIDPDQDGSRFVAVDCTLAAVDLKIGNDLRGIDDPSEAVRCSADFFDGESLGTLPGWTSGDLALVDVSAILHYSPDGPRRLDRRGWPAITTSLPVKVQALEDGIRGWTRLQL